MKFNINLIKRFFYYFYGEKFFKRFNYDWSNYPGRFAIIQKIIDIKKYENYLEIGCDKDSNFSKIKITGVHKTDFLISSINSGCLLKYIKSMSGIKFTTFFHKIRKSFFLI